MNKRGIGTVSRWVISERRGWLGILVLTLAMAVLASRTWGFSFVQFTDPHLFEAQDKGRKGQDNENRAAFESCIARVNSLQSERIRTNGEPFEFVVVTGDFGVEQLDSGDPQPTMADGVKMIAAMIVKSDVKVWLIVSGNNDLKNKEYPGTISRYHEFVDGLRTNSDVLASGITVSNLCPPLDLSSRTNSTSVEYTNAHLPNYHFIGLDNACFKSDGKGKKAVEYHNEQTNRLHQLWMTVTNSTRTNGHYAIIFYHIPEIDDPEPIFSKNTSALSERYEQKATAGDSLLYSAWTVSKDVREQWSNIVELPKVKWLIAGHFHSNQREIYSDLNSWTVTNTDTNVVMRSKYLSVELGKLYVAPPIAVKFQDKSAVQARGFSTYTIDPTAGRISPEIYWYEGFSKNGDGKPKPQKPAEQREIKQPVVKCPKCSPEKSSKRDGDCGNFEICYWAELTLGILLALGLYLLWNKWRNETGSGRSKPHPKGIKASPPSGGHDSTITHRHDDHLNRWPLAREVFGIATTGLADWSVRIGIYGEWGSGKSSVLEFVAQMAQENGHILLRFNPWQYSNRDSLWRAFVLAVYSEPAFRNLERGGWVHIKNKAYHIVSASKTVGGGVALINETAAKAFGAGIDLLKGTLSFTATDLDALENSLGEKRVIVLIDDLDRTAAELVPEILFALKELMNIPRFSFVCAFDPNIVGQVLAKHHPGFGNGLRFLEKIIDYPRYLPPASPEGLTKLALAEARCSCPFVPEPAIRESVPLLPANPRAVRQFIRLLALLGPQIERHNENELHWSVIIGGNLLKIRYPQIAYELLNAPSFWQSIGVIGLGLGGDDGDQKKVEAISEHIAKTCKNLDVKLNDAEKKDVERAMAALCTKVDAFIGITDDSIAYQFNIAEAPAAVTWKEFDTFWNAWKNKPESAIVSHWIDQHSKQQDRNDLDVYRELLSAAVQRYGVALHNADYVLAETDRPRLIDEASLLYNLVHSLVFDRGQISAVLKRIGDDQLIEIVQKFLSFAGSGLPAQTQFWPENEKFILEVAKYWAPDVLPLVKLIDPYTKLHDGHFRGPDGRALKQRLLELVLPTFAKQVIAGLRQENFINRLSENRPNTFEARCLLLDLSSPLWTMHRGEMLNVFSEARSNHLVQENAYELLHWLVLAHAGHAPIDPKQLDKLFSEQEVFDAVWQATIANPLGQRGVYQLRDLPRVAKHLGLKLAPPDWWEEIISVLVTPAPSNPPAGTNEADVPAKEEP